MYSIFQTDFSCHVVHSLHSPLVIYLHHDLEISSAHANRIRLIRLYLCSTLALDEQNLMAQRRHRVLIMVRIKYAKQEVGGHTHTS